MKCVLFLTVIILLCAIPVFGQDLSIVASAVRDDLVNHTGLTFTDADTTTTVLVVGSHLNLEEKVALQYLYREYPSFLKLRQQPDDVNQIEQLRTANSIVLVGGPGQNQLSRWYYDNTPSERTRTEYDRGIVVVWGTFRGQEFIILSNDRGFDNLPWASVQYSPLKGLLPDTYVPVTAAGLSVLLVVLFGFLQTYAENYFQFLGTRRKRIKKEFIGIQLGSIELRLRELIVMVVSAILFALTITWTFGVGQPSFFRLLALNVALTTLVFSFEQAVRIVLAWIMNLNTEYVLYPLGTLMTVVSSFFGSPMGKPGTVIREEAGTEEYRNKSGWISYIGTLVTFSMGVVFFFINYFYPSELAQMAMVVSSTVSYFEFLPIHPLNGKEVLQWQKRLWTITFACFTGIYVLIMFVL